MPGRHAVVARAASTDELACVFNFAQESELVAAKWAPLAQYTEQEFFQPMPLYKHLLQRCRAWAEGRYRGWRAERLESSIVRKRSDLLLWGEDDEPASARSAAPTEPESRL